MLKFLNTLRRWEYVEFSSGPYADGWHDTAWLKDNGDPAQWEVLYSLTDVMVDMNEVGGDLIYQGSDNLAVLITNVYIETDYCPLDIDFNYVYDDAGALVAPVEKWMLDK